MTGDRVGLITALTPIILAILGGIGWLIQHKISSTGKAPPGIDITQGQAIPITALTEYLDDELGEAQARARVYRDHLIRAGMDPDEILRQAGLLRPRKKEENYND